MQPEMRLDSFLKNFHDGTLEFFSRMLLEESEDPPLDLLWCLSAVKFMQENFQRKELASNVDHSRAFLSDNAYSRALAPDNANSRALAIDRANSMVFVSKSLFQCLVACIVEHNYSTLISISAFAPTIVMLVDVVAKLAINSALKTFNKASLKSLKNIVGQIMGYIVVCGNKREKSSGELSLLRALSCCGALLNCIDFWDLDKGLRCSIEKDLGDFLPFSSACVHVALYETCGMQHRA